MSVIYVKKTFDEPILQAASRMERKVAQAFLDAVAAIRASISMKALTEAFARRDAYQVLAILALDKKFAGALRGAGLEAGITSVRDAVQATFREGAKVALKELPRTVGMQMSFNMISPTAVNFLEQYEFVLIQQITEDAKQAIRQTLIRAFQEGGAPIAQAREMRAVIGLTARQELAVSNYRKALEGASTGFRNAINRGLRDRRFDATLERALRSGSGLPKAQIDKMVERYRERTLKRRAEMIARTETIRASNAGQREAWAQAKSQGLLREGTRRKWIASGDDRTCPVCMSLNGKVVGLDEPFTSTVMYPPEHPTCRCTVVLSFPKRS